MGRLEHRRPVRPRTARLRREHRTQDLPGSARGARERTGQVVAEGEGQAHLRLVRGDRNAIGPNIPRGLVDQPALADAGLAVHDHGGRAPLAARPSQSSANQFELVRAPEELGHARHPTCTSFQPDPRELPHDTSRWHPYRPSHRCGPGNGPGSEEGGAMRGFHCVDPSHGRIDFTGADDEELFEHIKAHTAEAHPDLTDSQVRDMMAGADWWRSMATSGQNSGSSPSAYDK